MAENKKLKVDNKQQSYEDIEKEIDYEVVPITESGHSVLRTQNLLHLPTHQMPEKFMECAEISASLSTPKKFHGPSISSPSKSDSLKLKNLTDGINEEFSNVETGLKVSLYHLSKAEMKEVESNLERVKRLNRILMGKFQLLTQQEQIMTASLKQSVHSLKQREIRLLQDLTNKQDEIQKLERQNDAQKEQLHRVEKQLLVETAQQIDLFDDFEESDGPNEGSTKITDSSSCTAPISKEDLLQDPPCGDKDD